MKHESHNRLSAGIRPMVKSAALALAIHSAFATCLGAVVIFGFRSTNSPDVVGYWNVAYLIDFPVLSLTRNMQGYWSSSSNWWIYGFAGPFLWILIVGGTQWTLLGALVGIIRFWSMQQSRQRNRLCMTCGYPQRVSESATCPECGTPYQDRSRSDTIDSQEIT